MIILVIIEIVNILIITIIISLMIVILLYLFFFLHVNIRDINQPIASDSLWLSPTVVRYCMWLFIDLLSCILSDGDCKYPGVSLS